MEVYRNIWWICLVYYCTLVFVDSGGTVNNYHRSNQRSFTKQYPVSGKDGLFTTASQKSAQIISLVRSREETISNVPKERMKYFAENSLRPESQLKKGMRFRREVTLHDEHFLAIKTSDPRNVFPKEVFFLESFDHEVGSGGESLHPDNVETEPVPSEFTGHTEDFVLPEETSVVETTESTELYILSTTVPQACFDTFCDSSQLKTNSNFNTLIVPEGTNVTLTCTLPSNNTAEFSLYWYKVNGSNYVQRLASRQPQLHMALLETDSLDSGMYTCVKWTSESCCCRETRVVVYQVPDYKYHLIIIGVVAIVCFLLCILLGLWRTWTVKKYVQQFKKAKKTKKQLLLP